MLLVEAARQAMMASTEIAFAEVSREPIQYVLSEMSIQFARFAFPLDVEIRVRILQSTISARGTGGVEVRAEFLQYGETVCTARAKATALPGRVSYLLEGRQALAVVRQASASIAESRRSNRPESASRLVIASVSE